MKSQARSDWSRRECLKATGLLAAAGCSMWAGRAWGAPPPATTAARSDKKPLFTISLAQWSLHPLLFDKKLEHLDFPKVAKREYGIDAVEYVNVFFNEKGSAAYNAELKKVCDGEGVTSVLIMCDGEGALGDADDAKRATAVENHRKWLDAARTLGCHSIRVNAQSSGTFEEQQKLAADGLRKLCELADPMGLNVIVENHWGLSSHGDWLVGVMKLIAHPRAGTLPDFGNFDPKEYDRYRGVEEMMVYAKGVSAKSHDFDAGGNEAEIDYGRMLRIVLKAGYRGRVGIEYEGKKIAPAEGIRATKALLERLRNELASEFT